MTSRHFSCVTYSRKPHKQMKTRSHQGFTIVELMVAIALSLVVVAVIGGVFLANSSTFRATDDASRLQENGRFAMQTVSRVVRQSGFIPADIASRVLVTNEAFPGPLAGIADARTIAGIDGTGPNNSDSLTIAFRGAPGGRLIDCSGADRTAAVIPVSTAVAALPAPITNTFYVAPSAAGVAAGNALWCDVTVAGATTSVELVSGVESFQVIYAVDVPDAAGKRDLSPDYYTSANNLNGPSFNNVIGVQVALIFKGAERATVTESQTNKVLRPFGSYDGSAGGDSGATYTISAADGLRTFRVVTSTINVRNRAA